ncbi:LOW QUALITY PROTEIN: uncharacterized protein LOC129198282, partial [Grus americana]|uniref:LOW QUALITY PROTEIN: uncharacterized protein LOC129198282 n=1 Tax=Grus americana TaxID=9117 RepID=UPI00240821D5
IRHQQAWTSPASNTVEVRNSSKQALLPAASSRGRRRQRRRRLCCRRWWKHSWRGTCWRGDAASCIGCSAFLVHVASSCPLAANGSMLDFNLALVFNKNPLVCYDPDAQRFVPCDWGLLHPVATQLAAILNNGTAWVQRAEARRWACDDLTPQFWAQMVMWRSEACSARGLCTGASCTGALHGDVAWGVATLHNRDVVGPGEHPPISAIPNGDWTYQAQVTLMVAPLAGDTFTCSVQHASLDRPLLEDWGPTLSPGLMGKVAAATVLMVLGLSTFIAGLYQYRARPPALGYTPLPGDNSPAGGDPSGGARSRREVQQQGPVMELEVVKQGLRVLWEQLAQRFAWSVRRMELLRCLQNFRMETRETPANLEEAQKAAEALGTDGAAGRGSVQSSTNMAKSKELLQHMEETHQEVREAIEKFNSKGDKHCAQMKGWLQEEKRYNEVVPKGPGEIGWVPTGPAGLGGLEEGRGGLRDSDPSFSQVLRQEIGQLDEAVEQEEIR